MKIFVLYLAFIGRIFTAVGDAFKGLIDPWNELKREKALIKAEEEKMEMEAQAKMNVNQINKEVQNANGSHATGL